MLGIRNADNFPPNFACRIRLETGGPWERFLAEEMRHVEYLKCGQFSAKFCFGMRRRSKILLSPEKGIEDVKVSSSIVVV